MINLKLIGSWVLRLSLLIAFLFMIKTSTWGQQFILQEQDKQLHFGAGMITSSLGYTWSYNKHQDKKRAIITGVCTALAAGVAKELLDGGRGGDIDPRDILATTMGGVTMSVTIPLFQPKKRRYKN